MKIPPVRVLFTNMMKAERKSKQALVDENTELRARLQEAEEALDSIRRGDVDALVISDKHGARVFTLHGAEQSYRAMIERMSEGAVVLSQDRIILYCNSRFAEILDEPLESIIGADALPFIVSADRQSFAKQLTRAQTEVQRGEIRFQCRNGRVAQVQLALSPFEFEGIQGVCLVATDYREKEARLRLALDAGRMGLWAWDFQRHRVLFDHTQCKLFGIDSEEEEFSPEEVLGRMVPEDCRLIQAHVAKAIKEGTDLEAEFRIVLSGDRVRWLALRGRVIRNDDGSPRQFIGVNFDVTHKKDQAEQLNTAKIAAEAANVAKDEFLAALSHELRTPLNPALMLASELEKSPGLPDQARADCGAIRKNIHLEARLIDDLLDLTRITHGKLQLNVQPVNAHEVIRYTAEILKEEVEIKDIRLTFDLSASEDCVMADPVRLQQIFWNVIKNAVKFTPEGGSVTVHTSEGADRKLSVKIVDTGIGIAPEDLTRIFATFGQGEHGPRFGGLGLGLAITRLLVERQGGEIRAHSAGFDCGSTFSIDLPLAPAGMSPPHVTPEQPAMPLSEKRRILLVEDHEPTRSTLVRLLQRRGYEISATADLTSGRLLASEERFDLVLSDLGLPDGSGLDLMAELRDRYGLSGIALSGYGMEQDVQRSIDAGFTVHLTKPIEIAVLERAIALVLGTRENAAAAS